MPLCVEDFLDIIDRCGRSYSHSVLSDTSSSNNYNKPLSYTYTPPSSKKEKSYNRKTYADNTSCAADHNSSDGLTESQSKTSAAVSDILNQKDETKKMTNVLYSTFSITTLVYIILIFFGIIDIEGSNFGKLVLGASW